MPFALVIIGLVVIISAVKGTHRELGAQIVKDFTGEGNFFYWFAAIGAIGALGASETFRPFSRMFMALIIIAMVIRNGGVFDKFMEAISAGPIAPSRPTPTTADQSKAVTPFDPMKSAIDFRALGAQLGVNFNPQTATTPAQNFQSVLSVGSKILGFF